VLIDFNGRGDSYQWAEIWFHTLTERAAAAATIAERAVEEQPFVLLEKN